MPFRKILVLPRPISPRLNAARRSHVNLNVEALESRSLMTTALTASFANGILTVNGTDNADRIAIVQDANTNRIMVRDNTHPGTDSLGAREAGERVKIILADGGKANSVAAGAVDKVVVNAQAGDDQVNLNYIDTWNPQPQAVSFALNRAAEVHGGAGDERRRGGTLISVPGVFPGTPISSPVTSLIEIRLTLPRFTRKMLP